jgi:carboxyl-terminal processing protease
VRAWTLYDKSYVDALRGVLFRGFQSNADALILDMRDGWGGGNPDVLQFFDRHLPLVQLTGRGGNPRVDNTRWRAPVALLVNEGTRSMKEIFAYGFKKYGYGELVGARSAGAVLGAVRYPLCRRSGPAARPGRRGPRRATAALVLPRCLETSQPSYRQSRAA